VVTTGYGSLGEIVADGGGAITVDPRDDHSIAAGVQRLLDDDALHAELSAAALARPRVTWDDYAATTWELFTGAPADPDPARDDIGAAR
jgi:glycosyltransferase involved in cell wall biosynthesis